MYKLKVKLFWFVYKFNYPFDCIKYWKIFNEVWDKEDINY